MLATISKARRSAYASRVSRASCFLTGAREDRTLNMPGMHSFSKDDAAVQTTDEKFSFPGPPSPPPSPRILSLFYGRGSGGRYAPATAAEIFNLILDTRVISGRDISVPRPYRGNIYYSSFSVTREKFAFPKARDPSFYI